MKTWCRGSIILRLSVFCTFLAVSSLASAQGPLDFGKRASDCFNSQGRTIRVERFDPTVPGRYPAVIILHGADGMERFGDEYRMAGRLLARNGYVGVLVHYYDAFMPEFDPGTPQGAVVNPHNFSIWLKTVTDSITYASGLCNVDPDRIGILGFSLGGYLAVTTSSIDPRVDGVVEFFGGLPDHSAKRVRRLAPTLILHGECDDTVPVAEAHKLANHLARLRVPYDIAIYPGQGHSLTGSAKTDAAARVRCFFDTYVKQ